MTTKAFLIFLIFSILNACGYKDDQTDLKIISEENVNFSLKSRGEFEVEGRDYAFGISIDDRIDATLPTDVRGRLYFPKVNPAQRPPAGFPLLVFLHGNHGTCGTLYEDGFRVDSSVDFTTTGKCPSGSIEAPSHLGYHYLATELAAMGHVVISINANLGITGRNDGPEGDPALIKARGRLVLKHLATFQKWNSAGAPKDVVDADIKGLLDFSRVGMMGHSRGGEGVRAAFQFYQNQAEGTYAHDIKNMKIKGILELAPVDRFADREFNVIDTNWTVVIPSCDGDVMNYAGVGTFNRRRTNQSGGFSSIFVVPGANHNQFNSEWHDADESCISGESLLARSVQEEVSLMVHKAFFMGFVSEPSQAINYRRVFDPQYALPADLEVLVDPTRESFDDGSQFEKLTDVKSNLKVSSKVTINDRDSFQFEWNAKDSKPSITVKFDQKVTLGGDQLIGLSFAAFDSFDACTLTQECDVPSQAPDLTIQLILADGSLSQSIASRDYLEKVAYNILITECKEFLRSSSYDGYCEPVKPLNQEQCHRFQGVTNDNVCYLSMSSLQRMLLFSELPIEAKDFGLSEQQSIAGFQITPKGSGKIFLDALVKFR